MEISQYGHFVAREGPTGIVRESTDGLNWYTLARGLIQWDEIGKFVSSSTGELFVLINPDNTVNNSALDVSLLVPIDHRLIGVPPETIVENGSIFTGTAFQPPEPVKPPSAITTKADVWRRANDAQVDQIDTELMKLNTRQRRIWDDSQFLQHDDPLFLMLRDAMTAAFGKAEADRILAPSESVNVRNGIVQAV